MMLLVVAEVLELDMMMAGRINVPQLMTGNDRSLPVKTVFSIVGRSTCCDVIISNLQSSLNVLMKALHIF